MLPRQKNQQSIQGNMKKKKKKVQNVLWEKKYNRQKSFDKVVSINLAMSLL